MPACEDVAEMTRHGFLAQEQFCGDRPIRATVSHQLEHLLLARRQRAFLSVAVGAIDCSEVGQRAQLLEGGTGSVDLHPCCVLIAQRSAGCADLEPSSWRLRMVHRLAAKDPTRGGEWVALTGVRPEPAEPGPSMAGLRLDVWCQHPAASSSSALAATVGGAEVRGLQGDLNASGQQSRSLRCVWVLGQRPIEARGRSRCLSLCGAQLRKSRLHLVAAACGRGVRAIGELEAAVQTMQLGQAVLCSADDHAVGRQPIPSALGFLGRLGPRSEKVQNLGAVDLADPSVGNETRLRITPAGQSSGPLRRSLQIEALHAGRNHRTVGQPGDLRSDDLGGDVAASIRRGCRRRQPCRRA